MKNKQRERKEELQPDKTERRKTSKNKNGRKE